MGAIAAAVGAGTAAFLGVGCRIASCGQQVQRMYNSVPRIIMTPPTSMPDVDAGRILARCLVAV